LGSSSCSQRKNRKDEYALKNLKDGNSSIYKLILMNLLVEYIIEAVNLHYGEGIAWLSHHEQQHEEIV
jgi:hypothetical protein